MIKVAPSILSADFGNMERDVRNLALWGADLVHCDVMDGVFVPNLTFGMPMVAAVRKASALPLDVHLMITKPERYALEFVRAGADAVTFHPEASERPEQLLQEIKKSGAKCGFALNPDVPFERFQHLVPFADIIVVMSVYAGFGGQKLIPECLEKLKEIKRFLVENAPNVILEIDGGITEENAAEARNAGADWIVAGSAVFRSDDPARTVRVLKGKSI